MRTQSERIQAALLRFKAPRSAAGDAQAKLAKPAGQLVVVNEPNLAALLLSSAGRPDAPVRKLAMAKGSSSV
jgi:hypothetical protein